MLDIGALGMLCGGVCMIGMMMALIGGLEAKKPKLWVVIGLILMGLGIAGCVCVSVPPYENSPDELYSTTHLYALTSGAGAHGYFVWGLGTMDDVQYYIGYTDVGEGYKQVKFDASKTLLVLNDEEIPRADTYQHMVVKNLFGVLPVKYGEEKTNKIYIPTDGLSNEYKVN